MSDRSDRPRAMPVSREEAATPAPDVRGARRERRAVRFGVSLPEDVACGLDQMVADRGLPSRSHAIASMVRHELLRHDVSLGAETLAGVVTIVYCDAARGVRRRLSEIQRKHLRATISSQHVFLEEDRSLEVLLVQGPPEELRELCDELAACRAVEQVELTVSRAVLPPLYRARAEEPSEGSGPKAVP